MTKNHFKLFKSDVPKSKGTASIKKHGNDSKPKRPMSEFDAKLLALQERSTKKMNGAKATKKPLVIAQPTFVLPMQTATVVTNVDVIEDLLPSEKGASAPIISSKDDTSCQNQFSVLADEEDKYKIKLAPSLFTLPPRVDSHEIDPDL